MNWSCRREECIQQSRTDSVHTKLKGNSTVILPPGEETILFVNDIVQKCYINKVHSVQSFWRSLFSIVPKIMLVYKKSVFIKLLVQCLLILKLRKLIAEPLKQYARHMSEKYVPSLLDINVDGKWKTPDIENGKQ